MPEQTGCSGYASVGYACAGDYCAAVDPGGDPSSCAEAAPSGWVVHISTCRCAPPGSGPPCLPGSYIASGFAPFSGSCTTCPDDSPLSPPAATSLSQCVAPPCDVGSYSETGLGPSCTQCPPTLPKSPLASTSASDCFNFGNVYAVSRTTDRVMGFNYQEQEFNLVKEGGSLANPWGIVFIDATTFLVSNFYTNNVVMEDTNGTMIRVVVEIEGPAGLVVTPDKKQLGVANWGRSSVLFFDADQYGARSGAALTAADAVGEVVSEVLPEEVVMGSSASDIYVQGDGAVWRLCLEDTGCRPDQFNAKMLGGYHLLGLAVINSLGVYLVTTSDLKILSCSTSVTNNNQNNCNVVAYMPENGASWDPAGLYADDINEVVYIADFVFSTVHAMAYDGT